MKVCIVGAGAIGGWIGTRLSAAGVEVSAIARGDTLAALRQHGWRLQTADGMLQAPVFAIRIAGCFSQFSVDQAQFAGHPQ